MTQSRTSNSIKNIKFALIFYFPNLILGFVSRKIFIDAIGVEVLGLNQTAQNLLGFLNLAELGIGSAIAFTLYKPLAIQDQKSINEIVTVQAWLYRRIAMIIGLVSVVLMSLFPIIFKNSGLPLWYAFASFGVFLYSSLLTYFINYKQIVLSASQQEHVITKHYHFVNLAKSVFQISAMIYSPYPYVSWLALHVIFSSIASWNLNRVIKRQFSTLKIEIKNGYFLLEKYSVIVTKVKQLFFHSIGGFMLNQSSSIIIFSFVNLSMVGIYANYALMSNSIRMLINAVFSGVNASVGNLVAEGDKTKILSVFEELFTSRFFIITTVLYCFFSLADSFIILWIGEQYLLNKNVLLIIVLSLFIMLSRSTVDSYLFASGLFQDVWAPIVEALLNISLSILLGFHFGILGILSGVFISLFIMIFLWKPYFLFKHGLAQSISFYVILYVKHIVIFVVSYLFTGVILDMLSLSYSTIASLILSAALHLTIFGIFSFVLSFIFIPGMRRFSLRIVHLFSSGFSGFS